MTDSAVTVDPATGRPGHPPVVVRTPATSANLGAGFDCFGLALGRHDELSAELTGGADGELVIEVTGQGADEVPRTADHLVVRAIARALAAAGRPGPLPGLRLSCTNRIPHGGGQGSSAAAIVGGLLVGRALSVQLGAPIELSEADVLDLAVAMEGHPDNVAPALLGGFTIAATGADGRPAVVSRTVHPQIRAVLFGAHTASSTEHARGLLPASVPHRDAVANVGAAALFVHAVTADPTHLWAATADRLHQDYRAAAMPASAALVRELRAAGYPAMISGAGPSVLVLTTSALDVQAWRRPGFDAAELMVDTAGAVVVTEGDQRSS